MRSTELFERITRQIADAIAAGAGTYDMPWRRWGEGTAHPINAISGRAYRGINVILLWAAAEEAGYSSGRWATYKQWAETGAQVRKGERSTSILFWKSAANDDGRSNDSDDHASDGRPRFIARVYCVFNEAQVEGAALVAPRPATSADERIAAAETFMANTGANIAHGGDRAYYRPSTDQICLPYFEQFAAPAAYYAVLAHETVHWTGAKKRLDRDLQNRFGTEAYAMEELVAELGSAFLAARLGIAVEPRPDHAAYIGTWLKVLHDDPRAILTASGKAQQAVDYLESLQEPDTSTKTPPAPARSAIPKRGHLDALCA